MVESNDLTQMVEIGTPASFRSRPAAILLKVIPDCRSSQCQATAVTEGQNANHCVRQQMAKCLPYPHGDTALKHLENAQFCFDRCKSHVLLTQPRWEVHQVD